MRKLAAIVAVDVVGYSRLMGEDEAGSVRAVRERREAARLLVADRGGSVVKTMGDGLLLEFPSVVDAVSCAPLIWAAVKLCVPTTNQSLVDEPMWYFFIAYSVMTVFGAEVPLGSALISWITGCWTLPPEGVWPGPTLALEP